MDRAQEDLIRNEAKKALRGKMRVLRKRLPPEARAKRSEAMTERLLALPEFRARDSWCVAGFVGVHAEIDVSAALEQARRRGATTALPRIEADPAKGTARLVWHRHEPGDVLRRGDFPVPEPLPTAPVVEPGDIDVVLVPGLVMDERGHRIGYGRGFYDRALLAMSNAFWCGVCFDFQFVGEIPSLPHDLPLHAVVTDGRVARV